MLQSTGSWRVRHNWETEQQWRNTKTLSKSYHFLYDLTSYPMLFLNLLNVFLTYLLGKQNTTKQPHLFRISRRQQFIPIYLCLPFKTLFYFDSLEFFTETSNSRENLTTLVFVVQSLCVCACWHSQFSHLWFFVTPWTVAHQTSLSMGFSRQEYWNGLPCPPPGHLLA